jgi:uncharacterized protein (DUF983 family)
MAKRPIRNQDDEADEGPSAADLERFSDVTRRCPECGTEVYDEAELCWKCGRAFTRADAAGPPRWVIATVILVLVTIVLWIVL